MKKNLFTTIFMGLIAIISMAQATSLTIDCQTPGWLSSMINYGDQVTVRDLKVTGYINETDLTFIGSLCKNQQLNGVINLEDVQIVATNNSDNNKLTKGYFGGHIQHLILPKSLVSATKCLSGVTLDTLTIGGESLPVITNSMFYSAVYSVGDGVRFNTHVKHLILREGVKRISDFAFYNNLYNGYGAHEEDCVFQSIDMPNTITYIGNYAFHCNYALKKIDIPNNVDTIGDLAFYDTKYLPDTLFLPDSLKHYYTTAFPKKTNQVIYIPEKVNKITNYTTHYNNSTNTYSYSIYMYFKNVDIHIKAKTPPGLDDNNGNQNSVKGSTIHVPKGTKTIYESTNPWNNATIIEETVVPQTIDIEADSITLTPNESEQLIVNVYPEDADTDITWSSSDNRVATVDASGVVLAKNKGRAIIYATTTDGSNLMDSCIVSVVQPVDGVTMEKHSLTLNAGDSEQLYANVLPVNADNKKLIWSTSDSEIAEVDADGNVTAKKCGVTFIKATSVDNPLATDSCKVTVIQPVTGISLNYNTVELHKIGETVQLVATVLPEDASNKEVRWVSSNQSVCMVANGTVVAVGYGTSVIIATTVDGSHMATCTVNVVEGADLPGDVNHDGEVNIADINAIIDIILGGNVDGQTRERADVNGDGEVNIADINAIIDIILKK